jgi:hypothetical protein
MHLVSLSPAAAEELDREFALHQTKAKETELVRELSKAWEAPVEREVKRAAQGQRVVAGSTSIHGTPMVRFDNRRSGPELGDILIVTAYRRGDVLHRCRALLFQAKTPTTRLPPDQEKLLRDWPVFNIWRPSIPDARWDAGPEGEAVPPSRRGTALLQVEAGTSPFRYEVDRPSQRKSLGECLRAMLRCRYSRAFGPRDATASGTNSWDQLITWLLQRTADPVLTSAFGSEPKALRGRRRPRPGSAVSIDPGSLAGDGEPSQEGDDDRLPVVLYVLVGGPEAGDVEPDR